MPVKRSRTTVKDRSRANLVTISSSTKKGKSSGPVTISSKAIDRSAQTTKNKKSKYRGASSDIIKIKSKDDTGVSRSLQTTKNKKLKDKFYKALKKKLPMLQERKTKVSELIIY